MRTIGSQGPNFFDNIGFIIGNGRIVSFWSDIGLGHGPLIDLFPDLYNLVSAPEANTEQKGTTRMEF